MPRAKVVCSVPGCPEVAQHRGRCRVHAAEAERVARRSVPTKVDEVKSRHRRRQVVASWRHRFGDVCPGYKRPPHSASDLTAQHWEALAVGGSSTQNLGVLCRGCNSAHGRDVQMYMMNKYNPGG